MANEEIKQHYHPEKFGSPVDLMKAIKREDDAELQELYEAHRKFGETMLAIIHNGRRQEMVLADRIWRGRTMNITPDAFTDLGNHSPEFQEFLGVFYANAHLVFGEIESMEMSNRLASHFMRDYYALLYGDRPGAYWRQHKVRKVQDAAEGDMEEMPGRWKGEN